MRRILVTTVLLVAALGLAGCTASAGSVQSDSPGDSIARAPVTAPEKATGTVETASTATSPRSAVTTGTLSITVDEPSVSAEKAVTITDGAGGHVDGRTEHPTTDGVPGSAQLVLRIPSAGLDAALTELKKLGRVENVSLSTQDVTGQSQDLAARITALSASVDRLVELMSRATTTADLVSIETALSDRQANLESLQAQKRGLDDQVDLATLTVDLGTASTAPVRPPATFVSGLIAGWGSLAAFLSGLLVVLGVALPWIACAAILCALVVYVVRRRRTRVVSHS
ncbi:DUF4349 domain-containing protein [Glaciihabitans sp. INWT7]|uniref:DUF4349 domain-containing protein n=1 Tax=Glaciihabitans sp. INWT7 TaxID=2596912 RepID=UPI001625A1B5|nr:DUF4349 domain-containing protein [Glaciihabitans sp. INWT7]QNE47742.1 DUF4349 domain-containing protein [Glaciihabitans sp. INWT7]